MSVCLSVCLSTGLDSSNGQTQNLEMRMQFIRGLRCSGLQARVTVLDLTI